MGVWLGQSVEVLVEDKHKGRWRGRSPQGKLVFFDDDRELKGQLAAVRITHTGPWSMSGEAANRRSPVTPTLESIPLTII
jgi:tRNA-2-methylthio-N6-dimethylallyladenosine synthase